MEIKTCEEYVLAELESFRNNAELYEDRCDELITELNNKTDDYVKLLYEYKNLKDDYSILENIINNSFVEDELEFNGDKYFKSTNNSYYFHIDSKEFKLIKGIKNKLNENI